MVAVSVFFLGSWIYPFVYRYPLLLNV
uniref:Uncharacterized protein n=1 Tax=Anguilla anguilla TaxID=7936 RepID=A0A0E9U5U7_ANGAN